MNKKIILFLCMFFILVFALENVSSLGITPGRKTVDFTPNLQIKVPFTVVNSEHEDMSIVFYVKGDLKEYIDLPVEYAEFKADEESKSFFYNLTLPEKLDKHGLHKAEIVALQVPKGMYFSEDDETYIGATIAVITQCHVHAPYPGKYADVELDVMSSEGKTLFILPIINRGKVDIVNAHASIDIYTSLNEKLTTLVSDSISIDSLESNKIIVEWDTADVNPGKYIAKATLLYDNEHKSLEKNFEVGQKALEIIEIRIDDFQLGGIAKFEALVENKWTQELKDAYLNILVYNDEGEVMADFKSPNYDIPASEKIEMVSYWDTVGVHRGTYDGKLILKHGDDSRERNIEMKITDNSIEISGLTGRVIVKDEEGFGTTKIIIIGIGFMILMNVVWFLIIRRMLQKRGK